MTVHIGVVQFPGSNCEHDVIAAVTGLGASATIIWHRHTDLSDYDAVILPGGFAHGDYLRPGAIARFSPVMGAVNDFAAAGGQVLGICNGFQILTEAGLLPGALQKNRGLRFICDEVDLTVASRISALTSSLVPGQRIKLAINHFEGNYTCDRRTLDELEADDRVVLRYVDNPNGSMGDIAGVCNAEGNVTGIMPHPERSWSALLGGADGALVLESYFKVLVRAMPARRRTVESTPTSRQEA
ncbi:MAG: phosphoribosylformylglycinamidine synthase subunit PurQ [Acidimicrobiales bacterium]